MALRTPSEMRMAALEDEVRLLKQQRDRLSARLDEARATIDRAIARFAAPLDPPIVIAESNIPDRIEDLTKFLDEIAKAEGTKT